NTKPSEETRQNPNSLEMLIINGDANPGSDEEEEEETTAELGAKILKASAFLYTDYRDNNVMVDWRGKTRISRGGWPGWNVKSIASGSIPSRPVYVRNASFNTIDPSPVPNLNVRRFRHYPLRMTSAGAQSAEVSAGEDTAVGVNLTVWVSLRCVPWCGLPTELTARLRVEFIPGSRFGAVQARPGGERGQGERAVM
ncbi:hypothetical protein Bbelb_176480, partial [Branchiostoma belcheri]